MADESNDRLVQLGPLRCSGEWIMPGWDRTFMSGAGVIGCVGRVIIQ